MHSIDHSAPSLRIQKPQVFGALLAQVKSVENSTIEILQAAERVKDPESDLAMDMETFKMKAEQAGFLNTVAFEDRDAVLHQVST